MKKENDTAGGAETPEQPSDGNRKVQPLVRCKVWYHRNGRRYGRMINFSEMPRIGETIWIKFKRNKARDFTSWYTVRVVRVDWDYRSSRDVMTPELRCDVICPAPNDTDDSRKTTGD